MLRGINKNIIEVVQTEHEYFEKAILFIRTDKNIDNENLKKESDEYISSLAYNPTQTFWGKHKRKILPALKYIAIALSASGVTFIITLIA